MLRVVGRSRMSSPANVATCRAFWTSTVGASADHRHRFRTLADGHRGVDGRGETGRQHDVVTLLTG